jgi:hypothetical protein
LRKWAVELLNKTAPVQFNQKTVGKDLEDGKVRIPAFSTLNTAPWFDEMLKSKYTSSLFPEASANGVTASASFTLGGKSLVSIWRPNSQAETIVLPATVTILKFSASGKKLLAATSQNKVFLLDTHPLFLSSVGMYSDIYTAPKRISDLEFNSDSTATAVMEDGERVSFDVPDSLFQ